MKPLDRNISILEHIIVYCEQIDETIRRFGNDYDVFLLTPSIAMQVPCVSFKSVNWPEN